jgi:hypothetical protein
LTPGKYNLLVLQGAKLDLTLTWTDDDNLPINLTGYTARLYIRRHVGATAILVEMTTENGRIVLGGAAGTIRLVLLATATDDMTWTHGVYDLELIPAGGEGEVIRLLEGAAYLSKEVTKPAVVV